MSVSFILESNEYTDSPFCTEMGEPQATENTVFVFKGLFLMDILFVVLHLCCIISI